MQKDSQVQDRQCQLILQYLLTMGYCNKQQASHLWQSWNTYKNNQTMTSPSHFLCQQGIPIEHIQKAIQAYQNAGKVPSESTQSSELAISNSRLAQHIVQKGLVNKVFLEQVLEECNQSNTNLGQTLVKNRYLQMSDLIHIMQEISGGSAKVTRNKPQTEAHSKNKLGGQGLQQGDFGNYIILNEIARGGMGIVYKAQEKSSERIVALKILLTGNDADSAQLQRFIREVKATSSLKHPNIIPIYDMGQQQGYQYFTMKCLEGGTLSQWIENPQISLKRKMETFAKICEALDLAHKNKILHRDIKPSNILLDTEGNPYVTDFGLAKFVDSNSALTQTGTAIGTPFYMSPEQVRGEKRIDHRSDIYSLGIVMYQLLTGKLPFEASTLTELYRKICEEAIVAPKKITPDIPKDLDAICMKCLYKPSEYRYSTALEISQDITRFYQGNKVKARKVHVKATAGRLQRQYKRQILMIFAALPIIVVIVFAIFWIYKSSAKQYNQALEAQLKCADAQGLFREKKFQEAIVSLRKVVQENPQIFQAHLLLAKIYHHLDNRDKTIYYLEQAKKLAPDNEELLYQQAVLYKELGKYPLALQSIDKCLSYKKDAPEYYRERAAIYRKLENMDSANNDIATAQSLEQKNLQQQIQRIENLLAKNDLINAQVLVSDILQQNPKFEEGYIIRSEIFYEKGEVSRALEDISQALELNPRSEYFFTRGTWLSQLEYYKQAIQNFQAALQHSSNATQGLQIQNRLAEELVRVQQFPEAFQIYQSIAKQNFSGISALSFAQSAFYLKNYDIATSQLEKALKQDNPTEKAIAQFYLGQIYFSEKRLNKARECFLESLKTEHPYLGTANYSLGKIYWQAKKIKNAQKHLVKATELLPLDVEVWNTLGDYFLANENYSQAKDAYSRCIQLTPWIPKFYQNRGDAYSKLMQLDLAEQDYLKCLELEPKNFNPFLKIVDVFFDGSLVGPAADIEFLLNNFIFKSYGTVEIELFQEKRKIAQQYIGESYQTSQNQDSPEKNLQQVERLIQVLGDSESPAVVEMSKNALLAIADNQILKMLQQAQTKYRQQPRVETRFQELIQSILHKFAEKNQVTMRQFLVRYYEAHDKDALKKILQTENHNSSLEYILKNKQEHPSIRFLAAQALKDLAFENSHQILIKNLKANNFLTRFFSLVTLHASGFSVGSLQSFIKAISHKNPYVRYLAVKFMPTEKVDLLKNLLTDADVRVKIYAAKKLWEQGFFDDSAEILRQGFQDSDSNVRFAAVATYWDTQKLRANLNKKFPEFSKKYLEPYIPELVKTSRDKDPEVRRVTLLRMVGLINKQIIEALKERLEDPNQQVRFQAIVSLGTKGSLQDLVPIVGNPEEPLLFRLATLIGVRAGDIKVAPIDAALIFRLTQDKDIRMRIFVLMIAASHGGSIASRYTMRFIDSPDERTRVGAIAGLIENSEPDQLPKMQSFLDEKYDWRTQLVAATVLAYGAMHRKLDRYVDLEHLEGSPNKFVRQGVALGYILPLLRKHFKMRPDDFENLKEPDWHREMLFEKFVYKVLDTSKELEEVSIENWVKYSEKATALDPENHIYHFQKGVLYLKLKQWEKSVQALEQATKQNPNFLIYQYILAKALYENQNYSKALVVVNKLLQDDPWHKNALLLQSQIASAMKESALAETASRRAFLIRD